MAGIITLNAQKEIATYVAMLIKGCNPAWIKMFGYDKEMACAHLASQYGITNDFLNVYTSNIGTDIISADILQQRLKVDPLNRTNALFAFETLFDQIIIVELTDKSSPFWGCILASCVVAIKNSLRGYSKDNEEDIIRAYIKDLEAFSLPKNMTLEQIFNGLVQEDLTECYFLLWVTLFLQNYEGFRNLATQELLK